MNHTLWAKRRATVGFAVLLISILTLGACRPAEKATPIPTPTASSPPARPKVYWPAGPLSVRGIALGITYNEFKGLKMPGEPDRKRVRPDCFPEQASGDRICLVASDPVEPFGATGHPFTIGEGRGDIQFIFVRAAGKQTRLGAIAFGADNDQLDHVLLFLKALYGEPKVSGGAAETGLGIKVDKAKLHWQNGDQVVVLETRCERVTRFCVRFTDVGLAEFRSRQVSQGLTDAQ